MLFSSVVTALITTIDLMNEYRRGVDQIDRSLDFIGKSYLPSLTDGVWVSDADQVQTQLDGLLRLPNIEYIGIGVDGRVRWSAGKVVSRRYVMLDVPLVREHRGRPMTIGNVQAGFMLMVFQYLVTRHLSTIAGFARRIDPGSPIVQALRLDRPTTGRRWRPDILDTVADSINGLSRSLHTALADLRQSDEHLHAITLETSAFLNEINRSGLITFANRNHPGLTRERLEGTPLVDWFPNSVRPRVD